MHNILSVLTHARSRRSPTISKSIPPLSSSLFHSTLDLSGLTKDSSFVKIDSEISHLEKRILALRNLRNTLPPISSLPNEILCKIFLISHDVDVDPHLNVLEKGKIEWRRVGKTRLVLSWVSRHWREVALSYPDLWSLLTNGKMEYNRACIIRSKNRYLTVYLRERLNDHIQECLSASSLSLRHLTLDDCGFSWDSLPISSTLTTLHIIYPNTRIAAETLAGMLRTATCLLDCKLISCLTGTNETWSLASSQRIHLPSLRTLTLHLRPTPLFFAFLSFFDIPNSSIDLATHGYKFSAEYFHTSLRFFSQYWNNTIHWKYKDLQHITVDCKSNGFNLALSTSPVGTAAPGESPRFTMSIESENFGDEAQVLAIISRYLSFERCRPVSVLLRSVSPTVVYTFAGVTTPQVLRLQNVFGLSENRPDLGSGEFSPLFPQLSMLEVDYKRYSSFREYLVGA
ncbi:hypothetical protein BDN72DRAFT_959655 [Pluteus cervinus]|uniref:Uncharacterized protein n=1 Tax=Pluteus cervinus TaxID=181527 RepID=A0ACD3AUJ0_9AGAR|nr:hypothetical protein BDN72DRAFT_959655 [Pluteus cervinus]